jgi:hypothetical protein
MVFISPETVFFTLETGFIIWEIEKISLMFSGAKATVIPFFGMSAGKNTHSIFICLHPNYFLINTFLFCAPPAFVFDAGERI